MCNVYQITKFILNANIAWFSCIDNASIITVNVCIVESLPRQNPAHELATNLILSNPRKNGS